METIIITIFYMIIIYIAYTIYSLFTTPLVGHFIKEEVSENFGDPSAITRTRIYTQSKKVSLHQGGLVTSRVFFNTLFNYFRLLATIDIPTIVHTALYSIVLFYVINFINPFITNRYLLFIIGFFLLNYIKIFSINYYNYRVNKRIVSELLTGEHSTKRGFI